MTTRLQWLSLQIVRRLWFRATAFSVMAVVTALLAAFVTPYIPADIPAKIGSDAVDALLGIIAASMLSVTIFSLSTLVSAYASATSHATPRATRLLSEDNTAQNALATFVGSFLFSLVGIIALQTGLYGERGRVVLYVVTLVVIALIVATLLRWIDHVSKLGRVGETTQRVEKAAARALRHRHQRPYLGGQPLTDPRSRPDDALAICADRYGYVAHIDMSALHEIAGDGPARIFVDALPGSYVDTSRALAWLDGRHTPEAVAAVREAFTVGEVRSFDQDPRFGAAVLAEIASHALSPSLNDAGTAIDVLGRATRLLAIWAEPPPQDAGDIRYPRIHVPPILLADLFDDVFTPIARDGAGSVEVGIRLQKMLRVLAGLGPNYRAAARHHSTLALARAEAALSLEDDRRRVREAADQVQAEPLGPTRAGLS
ncbi:MAG: DUF2254 domain-containing protein [Proteobacteria bacterium]|nr:DUF2254 domain-containing protein [Pseudomonadota bacterium]